MAGRKETPARRGISFLPISNISSLATVGYSGLRGGAALTPVPCLRRATAINYTDADEDAEKLLSFLDEVGRAMYMSSRSYADSRPRKLLARAKAKRTTGSQRTLAGVSCGV